MSNNNGAVSTPAVEVDTAANYQTIAIKTISAGHDRGLSPAGISNSELRKRTAGFSQTKDNTNSKAGGDLLDLRHKEGSSSKTNIHGTLMQTMEHLTNTAGRGPQQSANKSNSNTIEK